jgi:hypothetical protein
MYLGNSRVVLSSQPTVEESPESGWFAVCGTGAPLSGEYGPSFVAGDESEVLAMEIVDQYLYVSGYFFTTKTNDAITCTGSVTSIRIDGTDGSEKWNQFFNNPLPSQNTSKYYAMCGFNGNRLLIGGQIATGTPVDPLISFINIEDPLNPSQINSAFLDLKNTVGIFSMTRSFSSFDNGEGMTTATGFCGIQTFVENFELGEPSSTFLFKYDDDTPSGSIKPLISAVSYPPDTITSTRAIHFTDINSPTGEFYLASDSVSNKLYRLRGNTVETIQHPLVGFPSFSESDFRDFFIDANMSKGGNRTYLGGAVITTSTVQSVLNPNTTPSLTSSSVTSLITSSITTINKVIYNEEEHIIVSGNSGSGSMTQIVVGLFNKTNFKNLEFPTLAAGGRINCIVVDSSQNIYVGGKFSFMDANGRTASNVAKYIPPASKL